MPPCTFLCLHHCLLQVATGTAVGSTAANVSGRNQKRHTRKMEDSSQPKKKAATMAKSAQLGTLFAFGVTKKKQQQKPSKATKFTEANAKKEKEVIEIL